MNMKDYFRVILMTFALATVAIITVACSNPRPEMQGPVKANAGFCETYKMQVIENSDSNEERLRKLKENTNFQRICS